MWVDREYYYEVLRDKAVTELKVKTLETLLEDVRDRLRKCEQVGREERDRADRALDTQLMARGQAPIADPGRMIEADDPFVEDPGLLAEMRKDMEQYGGSALHMFVKDLAGEEPEVETSE